ncbi:MAG: DNA mismatch repair protein MutS [Candidatus Cloacimonetes bacterium]|nr:DNA mismatch repair protein MutS [Candidatus Cloacimonadota bacterium]
MLKQFLEIKEKHPDKLLLFRMGDFYETFFDDAKKAAKLLGITLTARNKNNDNPVPLAGFPYHALDNYLDKLIKQGVKVVICEQTEDPKQAKGLVKREIIDIITPGTVIDSKLIAKSDNNFLAAIYPGKEGRYGIAFLDISTAEFIFSEIEAIDLTNEIQRLNPVEIIVADEDFKHKLEEQFKDSGITMTLFENWYFDEQEAGKILNDHFGTATLEGFGAHDKLLGRTAAGIALSYLKTLKVDALDHITSLHYYSLSDYMQLDEVTRRNLELVRSMRYGSAFGSLISILDKTQTPMGSRLIKNWLMNPLLKKTEIEKRLQVVAAFKQEITQTDELRQVLDKIGDLSRIISKVGTGRVNPREVLALRNFLETAGELREILAQFDEPTIKELYNNIKDYSAITEFIDKSTHPEPPVVITEGNIIKDGYDNGLDELREISRNGKSWIARLEADERKKTGISSLKVGYNRVFGYYLEVTQAHKDKIPEHYIRKQTLVNAERYVSPQLKEYEAKVLGAEERIKSLEYELFQNVRQHLHDQIPLLQQFVDIVAKLDVFACFGWLAYYNDYVQPVFNDKGILQIAECRHPVIEKLLKDEQYIPNDVELNSTDNRIILLTGPNMAGKSTYLRQIGLLVIMAQSGCFVPAKSALLPVFDKVFTRVGASDNLAMGQSTFLVEMLETANILNSATSDSLILLDEIGRGTSTFDGLSLAWSIVEHIHNQPRLQAKTLFATHYHELTELENLLTGVKNYNIAVKEWNDTIVFLRKIKRGSADQSYGIQVARLAGVPNAVIKRAKEILSNLEEHELSPQGLSGQSRRQKKKKSNDQLDIFDAMVQIDTEKNDILEEIKNIDVNNLTPMEAINKLAELKKKL